MTNSDRRYVSPNKIYRLTTFVINLGIVIYTLTIGYYLLAGSVKIDIGFTKITIDGWGKPALILFALMAFRLMIHFSLDPATFRKQIFFIGMMIIALFLSFTAGELALRVIYWKGDTPQGPGYNANQRLLNPQNSRFPVMGAKRRPGIVRIFVQGDSITYGAVKNWFDIYPYLLLQKLNRMGENYELGAYAHGGMETYHHERILSEKIDQIDPDIIIYQWYINDIEVTKTGRPKKYSNLWRRNHSYKYWHQWLLEYSYLYYSLDRMIDKILPPVDRTYAEYLADEFTVDSMNWYIWRRSFHNWATTATTYAKRTIIMLYPALPFTGEYPLLDLHNAVKSSLGKTEFLMPGYAARHMVGEERPDKTATFGKSWGVKKESATNEYIVFGQYLLIKPGTHHVTFRLKGSGGDYEPIVILDVTTDKGQTIIAKKELSPDDLYPEGNWHDISLSFEISGSIAEYVEFRVKYLGGADLSLDTISLPTNYGIESLDLVPYLKGIVTHMSIYDAHPNERAYKIMADALYTVITTGKDPLANQPGAMINGE